MSKAAAEAGLGSPESRVPSPESESQSGQRRPPSGRIERTPPQSVDLEMCVLGGIMLEPQAAWPVVSELLSPSDFYLEGNALVFQLMGELFARGIPPDSVALLSELRARGLLEKAGGSGVVMGMLNSVPTAAGVEHHAQLVAEKSQARRLIRISTETIDEAYRQELPVGELVETAQDALSNLAGAGHTSTAQAVGELADQRMVEITELQRERDELLSRGQRGLPKSAGTQTGLYKLDFKTAGLPLGHIHTIAARPKVGKTMFALNLAWNIAVVQRQPVGFLSLEMDKMELTDRLLCIGAFNGVDVLDDSRFAGETPAPPTPAPPENDSGADGGQAGKKKKPKARWISRPGWISSNLLRGGEPLSELQRDRLSTAQRQLREAPLVIDRGSGLRIGEVGARIREMHRRHGCQVMFVDYLGLIISNGEANLAQEISRNLVGLHGLAGRLDLTLFMLAQLNRGAETRGDKRPLLSDFRDSGTIEEHSYSVMFLYRDAYYSKPQLAHGELQALEIDLAACRNGESGPITTMCALAAGKVVNTQ